MELSFVRIQNRFVRLDSIAYVDFLESGRAMMFVHGLTQEKQHIAVEPGDAIRLRGVLEKHLVGETPAAVGGVANGLPLPKFAGSQRPSYTLP